MIFGIASSVSALNAFGKKMATIANNVANVYSENFKKSRAIFKEEASGGVCVDIVRSETPGHRVFVEKDDEIVSKEGSNVDLAEELTQAIIAKRYYQANVKSLNTQEKMSGYLLDIKR